jgi:glycosyltransferase involved in cell wall biosynthesis
MFIKIKSFVKSSCHSIYHTRLGAAIWRRALNFVRRPFVEKVFLAAFYQSGLASKVIQPNDKYVSEYDWKVLAAKKHALVVIPWWGQDATCTNIRSLCASLKKLDYVVHLLHYNDNPFGGDDDCFDKVYSVFPLKRNNRRWNIHFPTSVLTQNLIDDWADSNLLRAVSTLSSVYNFEICLCNYAFLSLSLTALPATTLKLLYTHDIFAHRNEKLRDNGVESKFFDFSCTAEEERKAFERADYIIAVQKNDEDYIKSQGFNNTLTIPYVPESIVLDAKNRADVLVVGYLASSHRPNVVAISQFIKMLDENNEFNGKLELHIAGSICDSIGSVPDFVKILGRVNTVEEFYKNVDLLINPDCVASGIKIKCVEALSYGKPLVCTNYAMIGIDTDCEFHQCTDIKDCVNKVLLIANKPILLKSLSRKSTEVYSKFKKAYDPTLQLSRVIANFHR